MFSILKDQNELLAKVLSQLRLSKLFKAKLSGLKLTEYCRQTVLFSRFSAQIFIQGSTCIFARLRFSRKIFNTKLTLKIDFLTETLAY